MEKKETREPKARFWLEQTSILLAALRASSGRHYMALGLDILGTWP